MKIIDLRSLPLLLDGFDEPYVTIKGKPHFGPVHTVLQGEQETHHQMLQDTLAGKQLSLASYVGFGGWVNLGYMAAVCPKFAVLADINPLQAVYWQAVFDRIAFSSNLRAFERQLPDAEAETIDFIDKLPHALNGRGVKTAHAFRYHFHVQSLLERSYGFREESFQTIKALASHGRIALAVLDIKDGARVGSLRSLTEEKAGKDAASVVHVSNVLEFVSGSKGYDWAHTHCDGAAIATVKENISKLAFDDGSGDGHLIHTHTMAQPDRCVWHKTVPDFGYEVEKAISCDPQTQLTGDASEPIPLPMPFRIWRMEKTRARKLGHT